MSRQNWYQWVGSALFGSQNRRHRRVTRTTRKHCGFRPTIQTLENRALLSALAVVNTGLASPVSATGATLNGTVNPEGSTTTAAFQYSTNSAFTPTVQQTIATGFNNPQGVAVDAAGDVFVADYSNNAVKEILPNGTIKTIGSGFSSPTSVAVDATGDVFVADFGNNAVKEVLPNGTIKTIGSGFEGPDDVVVDASGDVFVADIYHSAIKEVLPNGTIQTIGSGFDFADGVAVDAAGDVFVADTGHGIVKEVLTDGTINNLASNIFVTSVAVDAAGDVFFNSANANRGAGAIEEILSSGTVQTIGSGFNNPQGFALDESGDLFVSDNGNNQVVELSPKSVPATPLSLSGSTAETVSGTLTGLAHGTTYYFRLVASNSGGLVADWQQPPESFTTLTPPTVVTQPASSILASGATLNGSVDPNGSTATVSFQYSTNSAFPPTVTRNIGPGFNTPSGVAVDAAGDVFVADPNNNAVDEILPNGKTQAIGSGFDFPQGVAVDSAGDVFVADTDHNAVKEVLPDGTIETIGSGFNQPTGVAVNTAGDLFVADFGNNAVKEVLPGGTIQDIGSGFADPYDVALDASGDVFVADFFNNAIEEVSGGNTNSIGGGFDLPTGVAVNAAGDVFVADYGNNAVKEILPNGTVQAIGSGFVHPADVTVDAAGDVFVADFSQGRVAELSPTTVTATPSPLSGSASTAVSATLTGLALGTTYYYRVVAASAAGTVSSSTATFATPVWAVGGPATMYNTGGPAITVAPAAMMASGAAVASSTLTVLDTNADADDVLNIQAAGNLAVSGTTLSYNGTVVGTFTGGAGSTPLVVSFNASATEAAVLAVIQNVTFSNTNLAPGNLADRTVTFELSNGAGDLSPDLTQTVDITTPPVLDLISVAVAYNTGGPAIVLAPGATLDTGDGDFADASLSVVNTNADADDQLGIQAGGNLTNSGSTLSYNGAAIATFTGGASSTPLVVSFNTSADQAAILAVVQNITFSNTTLAPNDLGDRALNYQLTDGAGNLGPMLTQTVIFTTPPVLAIAGPAVTYNTGGPAVAVAPQATLSSGDGDFSNASLSVINTNGGQSDRLGIQASGSLTISGTTLSYSGTAIATFAGGASATPLVVSFNINATQAAILAVAQNITLRNLSLSPGLLSNRNVTLQLTDGSGNLGAVVTQTVEFMTPPVLAIGGPKVTYNTGGPAIAVAPAATLSSGDGDFADASLSVVNINGGQSDRLGIQGSNGLTISAATISYNGTAIATFTGGADRTALVVSFNSNATQAAVLAVAQNVSFHNTVLNPGSLSNRMLNFQLTDGAGNHGAVVTQTVQFATPPVLTLSGPAVTYNTGGPAVAIVPAATLSSGDGDFANASLSVVNAHGGQSDRLGVQASGGLTVSGTTLSFNGTAVGTFTGGAGSKPLVVSFNGNATQAAIVAVAQNVTFHNTVLNPGSLSNRTVTFQLTDGANNRGAPVTQTVEFTTPPVLAIGGPAVTYTPGGASVAVAPSATLSSGDGAFANASLSVVDSTFSSYQADRLAIQSSGNLAVNGTSLAYGGVTIGSFTGGTAGKLTISFNANASEAAILAVVQNVTFSSVNPTPTIANRSIKFQLTDGSGNLGAAVTQTVKLQPAGQPG